MGASSSSSRFHRSTGADVVSNLVRSLEQLMAWEDRAPRVKQATTGAFVRPSKEGAVATAAEVDFDRVYAVLKEVERFIAAGGGPGKKSKKMREKAASFTGLPFTTAPLSLSAPATSTAPLSVSEEARSVAVAEARRMAVLAEIHGEQLPASTLFRRAAVSRIAGDLSAAQQAQREREEEGSGVEGLERKSASLASHATEDEAEKVEVVAKYLFVHAWLRRMLHAAEHVNNIPTHECVKLKSRLAAYSKQLKPKRADELGEMERLRLQRQHEQCGAALQSALRNWDKANIAAAWLERDFDLCYGSFIVRTTLHNVRCARDDIRSRLAIQPSEELKKHQAVLDHLLYELETSAHQLDRSRASHELDALSVGLSYFDRDEKGAITAAECLELSARLFDLLDVDRDGSISHSDLSRSVASSIEQLDNTLERIRQLKREIEALRERRLAGHAAESVDVQIAQNEALIEEKTREAKEKERDLQAIFNYFHTAFAVHVFGLTVDALQERRVTLTQLLRELERLQRDANTDPLHVDEAVLQLKRQESGQQWRQQPSQLQLPTQPTQTELGQTAAGRQQQLHTAAAAGEVKHSCDDPSVLHSCRWTEQEEAAAKEQRGAGSGSSALESLTGKFKQWTRGGSSSEQKRSSREEARAGSTGSAAEERGALTGVKESLSAAGEKLIHAASGMGEKTSETYEGVTARTESG